MKKNNKKYLIIVGLLFACSTCLNARSSMVATGGEQTGSGGSAWGSAQLPYFRHGRMKNGERNHCAAGSNHRYAGITSVHLFHGNKTRRTRISV